MIKAWHPGHCFISLPHTANHAISHAAVRKLHNAPFQPAKMCVTHDPYAYANQHFHVRDLAGLVLQINFSVLIILSWSI